MTTRNDWYPFAGNKVEIMRKTYNLHHEIHTRRLLELGAFVGIDSLILAKLCDELICLEGREENAIELKRRLDEFSLDADIRVIDLESVSLKKEVGFVDCVWASGVLYHLQRPWELIKEISEVSSICLGWTHLSITESDISEGYHGRLWNEDIGKPLSGFSNFSFWLTEDEFVRAWKDAGMSCSWLTPRREHPAGDVEAQFIATK